MGIFTTQNEQQEGPVNIAESLIAVVAPHFCVGCGERGDLLCSKCIHLLGEPVSGQCVYCGKTCFEDSTCNQCAHDRTINRLSIRCTYKDVPKLLIKQLKYHHARSAAKVIADSLQIYPEQIHERTVIVPIPTASSRIRHRGYDQSVLIARHLGKSYGVKVSELLVRHGQTRQVGSHRNTRLVQLKDSYTVKNRIQIVGAHVILVDDVMTTGATIETAARVLKKAGAREVDACIFARAE